MIRTIFPTVLSLVMLIHPLIASAQAQTPPQQRGAPAPAPQQSAPQTPAPQRGQQTSPPQTSPPQTSAPQRGQRAAAKPPMPMTLRQVIESLITLKSSSRVEDLVSKSGVRFQATPAVLDILKEFGAGPKLLSMIPAAAAPASAPAAKVAGPLTVMCEPKDCTIVVGEMYKGTTSQNRMTITGLNAGESMVEVFADGYEHVTRRVELEEGKPREEMFSLKRNPLVLQQSGAAALLKTVANVGGTDGFVELADMEGSGTLQWVNSGGKTEEWTMTFTKRVGKDILATFKTKEGECTASVAAQASKQDCKGGLRNGGEKIAEQGTSLFLSYQIQDVIQTLLKRPLAALDADENRVESRDAKDAYLLTIGNDGLPSSLIYRIADNNAPIQIEYSNYLKVGDARYPGRISIGRQNSAPVWVFTLKDVRSKISRRQ
jgi:PEGA domain